MTERIKLTEVDRRDLFKDGELVRLGNYSISPDLIYGIHIPTHNRTEGELIMKQVQEDHEKAEKWTELTKKYGVYDCSPENIINYIMDKRKEIKQLKEDRQRLVNDFEKGMKKALDYNHNLKQKLEKIDKWFNWAKPEMFVPIVHAYKELDSQEKE